MKLFYLLILSLLFATPLLSQQQDYLVAVDLTQADELNRFEQLGLPVYDISNEVLITTVSKEVYRGIAPTGQVTILDTDPEKHTYMVIEKKRGALTEIPVNGKVLFRTEDRLIVKDMDINAGELSAAGYSFTELVNTGRTFKNEKITGHMTITADIDSLISSIVSDINQDSVRYWIQSLQDFGTRFLLADNRREVSVWIRDEFIRMGYTDAYIDSFQYQGDWQYNAVAVYNSSYGSDEYIVYGGHHDAITYTDPMTFAPGADDNASGTAAALETARVLMLNNYQSDANIVFVTFAAEEYGLWGSKYHAQQLQSSGTNVKLMINHDMISHTYDPVDQSKVDINYYSGSEAYSSLAIQMVNDYTILTPNMGSQNSSGSDSRSYYNVGYNAVYFEENDFSPYYHSDADTIGNYSMPFAAEVIKSSCATLISADALPGTITDMQVVDYGTGTELLVTWNELSAPDIAFYRVSVGTQSGVYTASTDITGDSTIVGSLTEGTLYYVGITAYDTDGNAGFTVEKSGTPMSSPLTPENFTAEPDLDGVAMVWNANDEYDLAGYNVYRTETMGGTAAKLNASVLTDTLYRDDTGQNGVYYYYQVKAVDDQDNESIGTDWLRSRVVSLDQGILIVDETADGDGSLGSPTDEEVDAFFESLLENFDHESYDVIDQGGIGLADLGAYSVIVWHGNDLTDQGTAYGILEDLAKYLDYGGKFFYNGYRPARAFANNNSITATYSPGEFIYDYLKIGSSENSLLSRFNKAEADLYDYVDIWVDSSKTLPALDYHLRNIETIGTAPQGEEIYLFQSGSGGSFDGEPVGVEYDGTTFKTVVLSFPLYYMDSYWAKRLMEYVVNVRFSEPVGIAETTDLPVTYNLGQNYPNPFNPSTKISFSLPEQGMVSLKVYDILGREAAVLIEGEMNAGNHSVVFDASALASGVYFYTLRSADFTAVKKMLLLR